MANDVRDECPCVKNPMYLFREHDCSLPNVVGDVEMDDVEIFILWDMNVDSAVAIPKMMSMHQTLEGARDMIPEGYGADADEAIPYYPLVENYGDYAISRHIAGK